MSKKDDAEDKFENDFEPTDTPAEEVTGVPWEELVFQNIDMVAFKERMEQAEITTYADALKKRQMIYGFLQTMYAVDVATIVDFARKHSMNKEK